MASYMMVGFTASARQEAVLNRNEQAGEEEEEQECATAAVYGSPDTASYKQSEEKMSQHQQSKGNQCQWCFPGPCRSIDHSPSDSAVDSSFVTGKNCNTAGAPSDIRKDDDRKRCPASSSSSSSSYSSSSSRGTAVPLDKQESQRELPPLKRSEKISTQKQEESVSNGDRITLRRKRANTSHDCRLGRENTIGGDGVGDRTPGDLKLEIDVPSSRTPSRGLSDKVQLEQPGKDVNKHVDRTAVDSLKAHTQKKYYIRNAIWDENGDISPNAPPPLPAGAHQKLRLCRSLDPNLLSDSQSTAEGEKNDQSQNGGNRSEKQGSLRIRSNKQKRLLRTIKSVDSVVVPRAVDENPNECSSPTSPLSRLFSSPSTRRRFAYFSKLTSSMKASSNNPYSSSSPTGKGDSGDGKVGNESIDITSSPPSSPSGLRRGKFTGAPGATIRLMPRKRWKGKAPKPAPSSSSTGTYDILHPAWSPLGNGLWESSKGRRLQLRPKPLIHLSDVERRHLKIVAQHKLQQLSLGPVNIPRDLSELKKKKGGLLKGGRNKATNFFDSWRENKDSKDNTPLIFGIPLEKCLQNDQELRQIEAHKSRERRESLDLAQSIGLQNRRRSSRSLHDFERPRRCKAGLLLSSPQLSRKSSASSTALLEALSLSSTVNESHRRARRASLAPNADLKIPRVVSACFRFIEAYGLRTEGIFRVSGSKKRVRQIRESYDKGDVVIFARDQSPHDVGALLKEYFRDLPEPLLTRDLYNIFTSLTKFDSYEEKLSTMRLGVCLLPVVHRDVLYSLLKFLAIVADEAERPDHDSEGNEISGSKMNAQNLGTLFGPNILRKTKGGLVPEKEKDIHAGAVAQVEKTRDVILTVCFLIRHYKEIYQIPVSLQEEVLRTISETDPDALDFILNQRRQEMSFAEEPTQEDTNNTTTNFTTNSPADTTSSSSGTFPCVMDDSSLASLSTIEDLINEKNFSDFDGNIPSRGSSDSLDALDEEDDDEDDTTVKYQDFASIPFTKTSNHISQSTGDNAQARSRDGSDTINEAHLCNGPREGPRNLLTRSPHVIRRDATPKADVGSDPATQTLSGGLVVPPNHQVKRGSIGLYEETMMALGISPHTNGQSRSDCEPPAADLNSNVMEGARDRCQTCLGEKDGHPPYDVTNSHVGSKRSSVTSASSMSGSSSSSNASLVHVDAPHPPGADHKKKLPNYDEVLKIKELGVKNYVTVNSSKYFVPVPHLTEEMKSHGEKGGKVHSTTETGSKVDQESIASLDKSLPPYNKIRRRDHVTGEKPHHSPPPSYTKNYSNSQEPRAPLVTSPLASRRATGTSASSAGNFPSRDSSVSPHVSPTKNKRYSPVTSPLASRRAVGVMKENRVRGVSSSPVRSRKTGVTTSPLASPGVSRKTLLQSAGRRDSPLLAWDHHDPTEMGPPSSLSQREEASREVASRVLLRDFPPKISLYHTWDFLDLNDEEGEFDGPETYV